MCEVVTVRIMHGDCREVLATLPDASVQMVCTSPPYYQLRDAGDSRQIGMEDSPANYIEQLVTVFREVRRVLRDDGTVWLNLGDSYTPTNRGERAKPRKEGPLNTWQARSMYSDLPTKRTVIQGCAAEGFKDKDRMM
ncbi:MAG: DNA methyltransferase, partial [Acidimicrobiales bacterium]